MKITALIENTAANPNCKPKHGLSLYIETDKHRLLFDVGSSSLFISNAENLGIDIKAVDTLVVSHGHIDHGGGIVDFVESNKTAKIYVRKKAFEAHFTKVLGLKIKIGLSWTLIKSHRFIFTDAVQKIDDELTLFSDISGNEFLPTSNKKLYQERDGQFGQDDFLHEKNLLIAENGKTVLISGCSHKGVYNILRTAHQHADKIDVCIGGFHLYDPLTRKYESDEFIIALANSLKETGVKFYTCHCTGQKVYRKMKSIIGDNLQYISTGQQIEL